MNNSERSNEILELRKQNFIQRTEKLHGELRINFLKGTYRGELTVGEQEEIKKLELMILRLGSCLRQRGY